MGRRPLGYSRHRGAVRIAPTTPGDFDSGRRLLAEGGVLLLAVASLWDNIRAHGDVAAGSAPERVADIELLLDLVARGDVTVVHDGDYDLEHIVDAYRRVDSGHKRGNVIVHPARRPRCSAMTTTVDDIVAARDQDP